MVAILISCFLLSHVQGQGTEVLDLYGIINVLYLKADKNHDGMITQSELEDVYHGFDTDKNGKVSQTEFVTLWRAITGETEEQANAFFYLADINDDNIVDQHDLAPLYQVFDLDGDGQVTANEFAKKWAGIITETPLAVLFERSDSNKDNSLRDGSVNKSEMEQGWTSDKLGLVASSDTLFTHMDVNHDGRISTSDLDHLFTNYDSN
ncbi:hypothetical protein KUTeg_022247, partial [Tegillarca granosa]